MTEIFWAVEESENSPCAVVAGFAKIEVRDAWIEDNPKRKAVTYDELQAMQSEDSEIIAKVQSSQLLAPVKFPGNDALADWINNTSPNPTVRRCIADYSRWN